MIVNYTEQGWEVITQRAHGIVAAQIGFQWKASERPERWVETLLAIAEHDDAEIELDGEKLITETGGPLNFAMKQFDKQHCERLEMMTATKSRYIALLVSMHICFVYGGFEKDNKEAKEFLDRQRQLQEKWQQDLRVTEAEAKRIYYLVEWCDAISLILCRKQMPPEMRSIEISTGPDNKVYQLQQIGENTVTVSPWPFESKSFELSYESRMIRQLKFTNSEQFRAAFLQAPVTENRLIVQQVAKLKKPSKVRTG